MSVAVSQRRVAMAQADGGQEEILKEKARRSLGQIFKHYKSLWEARRTPE